MRIKNIFLFGTLLLSLLLCSLYVDAAIAQTWCKGLSWGNACFNGTTGVLQLTGLYLNWSYVMNAPSTVGPVGPQGPAGADGINGTWDGLAVNCTATQYSRYNGSEFICDDNFNTTKNMNLNDKDIENVNTLFVHNITGRSPIFIGSPIITETYINASYFNGDSLGASVLRANATLCSVGYYARGVNGSLEAQGCESVFNTINGTAIETTGNAASATMLAANGLNCNLGYYPLGIDQYGNVESCTYINMSAGPQGPPGIDGLNGTNGINGIDGLNGTNGIDGLNGTNGIDGSNFTYSAYFDQTLNTTSNVVFRSASMDYLQFNASYPDGATPVEGQLYWDSVDKTLAIGMPGGDTTLQIGQESFLPRVTNKQGVAITNCQVVYLSGATGSNPEVKLVNFSNYRQAQAVSGMVTETSIGINQKGYATTSGIVHDCNTLGMTEGASLFGTGIGGYSTTFPTKGQPVVFIGTVLLASETAGEILFNPMYVSNIDDLINVNSSNVDGTYLKYDASRGLWQSVVDSDIDWDYKLNESTFLNQDYATREPTGMPDFYRSSSTLFFNNSNRQFKLIGPYDIYINGTRYSKTTDTVTIPDATGINFIYYKSGTMEQSVNSWGFKNTAQIATVYWNNRTQTGLVADERHGIGMDWITHEYVHENFGARYTSGFAGTFTDTTFTIGAGEFYDDDNEFMISQETRCNVIYREGSTVKWLNNQTQYYYKNATGPYYDNNGVLTLYTSAQFIAVWFYVTNDKDNPIYCILGQRIDTSLANAIANNVPSTLSFATLPLPELKSLYRVILRGDATPYEATGTVDYRTTSAIPTGTYTATSHGTLSGLTADDHTQYLLAEGTRALTGNWDAGRYDITAKTFIGNVTATNITATNYVLSSNTNTVVTGNATCVIIKGATSQLEIC